MRVFLHNSCERLVNKIQQLKKKHIKEILNLKKAKEEAAKKKKDN